MAVGVERRRWLTARFEGLGWATISILGVIVVLWVFRVGETWAPLWVLTAGLGYLLLPCWAIVAVAAALRSWRLALAAGVLVVVHAVTVLPMMPWQGSAPGGEGVSVASVNLFVDNPSLDEAIGQLVREPHDVLLVQEFTAAMQAAFAASDLHDLYPHRLQLPGYTTGSAVYSRFPFSGTARPLPGTESVVISVDLPDGRELALVNVHVIASELGLWRAELHALDRHLDDLPEPWLAMGDYNATFHHRLYTDLLADGRRDAHLATGRGLARSWPASKPIPALELIDHAILSPSVRPLATSERTIAGSDHRMIVVELDL